MLKALAEYADEYGMEAQISLEERMGLRYRRLPWLYL